MDNPCSPTGTFRQAVAGSGSYPRAKCGGVRKENRASLAPSQMTDASLPRTRPPRKPCSKPVVRRPLGGSLLARSRHSTLAGDNRPPRRGAEGPGLWPGSPPVDQSHFVAAQRESIGRVIDAPATLRRSDRKKDRGNAECSLSRFLADRHTARSFRESERSPDNRGDTQDAFL